MATTKTVLKQRVERGAALLDKRHPEWCKRIDLVKLNMRDGHQCVLGQVYGHFGNGLTELHIQAWRYGFIPTTKSIADENSDYARLKPLWRKAVEARC